VVTQELATRIAIEGIFYSAAGFVIAVSVFWPWWKSQLGWTVVAKSLALAVAVFPAMLAYWFGPGVYHRCPWLQWASIGAMWLIPPILVWRAVVIWHAQRTARGIL
jgi:hypothetical protein